MTRGLLETPPKAKIELADAPAPARQYSRPQINPYQPRFAQQRQPWQRAGCRAQEGGPFL